MEEEIKRGYLVSSGTWFPNNPEFGTGEKKVVESLSNVGFAHSGDYTMVYNARDIRDAIKHAKDAETILHKEYVDDDDIVSDVVHVIERSENGWQEVVY